MTWSLSSAQILQAGERRRRAVQMRLAGVGVDETARCCELARGTVIAAHQAYRRGGWATVEVARSRRPAGSGRLLSAAPEASVQHLVCEHTPDELGMDCMLWSRAAVAELIGVRCGIKLPVRTMGLYLALWGPTPQKPLERAYEQSPAMVKRWLDEDYPAIAARARAERTQMGDRVQLDTMKVAPGVYQYTAIDDCLRFSVLGVASRRNAASTLAFLERVIEEMPSAIERMQTDRGTEFFAERVQRWLTDQGIKFRPIPPRSPHLNGKVERSQLTDLQEFWTLVDAKTDDIAEQIELWQFDFNWRRPHGSLAGRTPIDRVSELIDCTPLHAEVSDATTQAASACGSAVGTLIKLKSSPRH